MNPQSRNAQPQVSPVDGDGGGGGGPVGRNPRAIIDTIHYLKAIKDMLPGGTDTYHHTNIDVMINILAKSGNAQPQVPPVNGGGGAGGGGPVGRNRPTLHDVLAYLQEIKDTFPFHPRDHIVKLLLAVMRDYRAKRINTHGLIAKVKEIFKGHPNLILRFQIFLPNGYEIKLSDDDEEAIRFVDSVLNDIEPSMNP